VQAIAAVQAYRGHLATMTGRLHPDMIDAMSEDPDQVPFLIQAFEAARLEAEERSRRVAASAPQQ
jgi:hypothetical protein